MAPSGIPCPCCIPGGIIPGGMGGCAGCIIRFSIGTTGRRIIGWGGGRSTRITWQTAMVIKLNAASAMHTFT
jgi:hypothetical protein